MVGVNIVSLLSVYEATAPRISKDLDLNFQL